MGESWLPIILVVFQKQVVRHRTTNPYSLAVAAVYSAFKYSQPFKQAGNVGQFYYSPIADWGPGGGGGGAEKTAPCLRSPSDFMVEEFQPGTLGFAAQSLKH